MRELAETRSRLLELETTQANRMQANIELQENCDFLQKIFNRLPHILYIFDLSQGRINYINAQIKEVLGYHPQELYNSGLEWMAQHIHPDDRYLLHEISRRFLHLPDQEILLSEYRLQHSNGEWRWMSNREVIFSRSEDGTPRQVLGCVTDITEHKQVETALRQSSTKLREAQHLAHVGSWEFDTATYAMRWSEETFRIFGFNPTQPEPTHPEFVQWIYPEDRPSFERFLDRAMKDGIFSEIEYRLVRPNGSIRHINLRVEGIFNYEGQVRGLFGVVTDVTERRRLEQLLRSQAEREQLLGLVTQRIHQSLDLDEILTTAVTEVRRTLHVDRALIVQLHSQGTGSVIKQAILPNYPLAVQTILLKDCQSLEHPDFYGDRQPQVIDDVTMHEWASCLATLTQDTAVKSEVIVPIVQNANGSTQIWGLLIVHACSQHRHWQPAEVELLQHISEQLAIAIQQSELYQQVQHFNLNLEHQVQQRTVELQAALYFEAVLKRITDAVRDSLDEAQILQTAVEELAFALRVTHCDTALYSHDKSTSTIFYDCTPKSQSAKGKIIQISDFPDIYQQLLAGHHLHFSNLIIRPEIRPDTQYSTVLACPILNDREVLGDLWLRKSPNEVFDEQEIRLVHQVANQCAIALRQSRLYQASQAQVQELEQLNRLKDDFLSTVSHELRTPLTNIKMATQMLELLLKQLGILSTATNPDANALPSQNNVDRYFQILKTECQREIGLVNDLLDQNRLEANIEPITQAKKDIQKIIHLIIKKFTKMKNRKKKKH
ncbi:MAG: PAS domain-containing protein, partial [Oculatellaceae cyanobacterium bins.114]|nr:PAS domain-containing protein [Oculatellaceae cyanobacterium bins.114]